jgi:hypothetical protein
MAFWVLLVQVHCIGQDGNHADTVYMLMES